MTLKAETKTELACEEVRISDSKERPGMLLMVSDFAQETSLHGVQFILGASTSTPRRLFWVLVVLAQLIAFIVILVTQLRYVSDGPVLTKVLNNYVPEIPFPAVIICPQISNLSHEKLSQWENNILTNFEDVNITYFSSLTAKEYAQINIAQILKSRLRLQDELVDHCFFDDRNCSMYVKKIWSHRSMCYTINSALPDEEKIRFANFSHGKEDDLPPLVCKSAGIRGGLGLLLRLYGLDKSGVKILLHFPDERITQAESEFLQFAPGTQNYIGVKVRKSTFLPAPYKAFGNRYCKVTSGDRRHPLVRRGRYTLRACQEACQLQWWRDMCGCAIDMEGDDMCDPLRLINCISDMRNALVANNISKPSCPCPIPCEEVVYDMTHSSTRLTIPDVIESERENYMFVNIHFDRLRIESTEQVPDYTSEDVFASVGGQMGLFLGASIITLIELGELLVRCAYRWVIARRSNSSSNAISSSGSNTGSNSSSNSISSSGSNTGSNSSSSPASNSGFEVSQ